MQLSILLKQFISNALCYSGLITNKIVKYGAGSSFILMYHRIIKQDIRNDPVQPGMFVTPACFEMHLRTLQSYFCIFPLNEIAHQYSTSIRKPQRKPFCAITFDDGWRDFYQNAYPILKSLNIPATVFLPTNFIGTEQWFWTDRLTIILKNKKMRSLPNSSTMSTIIKSLNELTGTFGSRLEQAISILKPFPLIEIEKVLTQMESLADATPQKNERMFLNWQEIKEMNVSGLISFGSHTANHQILTTIEDSEIKKELHLSKQKLITEKVVNEVDVPFCYPNGNYNEEIAKIVKEAGYTSAVTTKKGWNSIQADPFTLKRIGIHQDISSSKSLFLCRLANIF
jgi:peptidoglycan/xylan/chitin deacetylase (PgdA/CDA1 family)